MEVGSFCFAASPSPNAVQVGISSALFRAHFVDIIYFAKCKLSTKCEGLMQRIHLNFERGY